jgi:hypothetical protein
VTYRQAAVRDLPTLDLRVDPPFQMSLAFVAAALFLAAGLGLLAAVTFGTVTTSDGKGSAGALIVLGGMGVAFTLGGVVFAVWGWRTLATLVRFSASEDDVKVDWRRRGQVVRSETVARKDVIDVMITDEPASGGGHTHALALNTREGTITLSTARSGMGTAFYSKQRDALAAFLGVPARS